MKHILSVMIFVLLLANISIGQVANTPSMGWNSWDAFGRTISESEVRRTARRQTMVFDSDCRMVDDPEAEVRKILLA